MEKSLVNHCHKQNTIGCDENIDFVDTEEHMKTVIIGLPEEPVLENPHLQTV